jgi:hypothetical protein
MSWIFITILAVIALTLLVLGWRQIAAGRRTGPTPATQPLPDPPVSFASTRPDPKQRPNLVGGGCDLLFGLGWTGFSLLFVIVPLAVLIAEGRTARLLNETGVTTEAVVINRRIDSDSDGSTYYVTYRYDVPLPQGYRSRLTHTESVSRKMYEAMPIESRVTIRYAADDPAVARLAGRSRTMELVFMIFFLLFGGLFVLIGVAMVYSSGQGVNNARALARRGETTTARLTERWIETDSEGDKQYCVAVRFAVPGRPDVTVAEYNRRAYDRFFEGASISVRYVPDRPEICRLEI